jgi:hypothetical protein
MVGELKLLGKALEIIGVEPSFQGCQIIDSIIRVENG